MKNIFIVIFCCFVFAFYFLHNNFSPVVHAIPKYIPGPLPPIDDEEKIIPIKLITRTPLVTVSPDPIVDKVTIATSATCVLKKAGDADCNETINTLDYDRWKCEILGRGRCILDDNAISLSNTSYSTFSTLSSDFNGDGKVTIADFEILRSSLYK